MSELVSSKASVEESLSSSKQSVAVGESTPAKRKGLVSTPASSTRVSKTPLSAKIGKQLAFSPVRTKSSLVKTPKSKSNTPNTRKTLSTTPKTKALPDAETIISQILEEEVEEVKEEPLIITPSATHSKISIDYDNLYIKFCSPGTANNVSVMVNNGCDITTGEQKIFYFEIEVIRCIKDSSIALGWSSRKGYCHSFPGYDKISYAYQGDVGAIMHNSEQCDITYKFSAGDCVGAGIILPQKHLFFTYNGSFIGKYFDLSDFENIADKDNDKDILTESFRYEYEPCVGIFRYTYRDGAEEKELYIREKRNTRLDNKILKEYFTVKKKVEYDPLVFYPVIGSNSPCSIETNFGQKPFRFDISTLDLSEPIPVRKSFENISVNNESSEEEVKIVESIHNQSLSELKELLVHYKGDINLVNENGSSLLHIACSIFPKDEVNYSNIVATLIEKGCDPNKLDNEKRTALHISCIKCNIHAVRALLKCSLVDMNVRVGKNTAVDFIISVIDIKSLSIDSVEFDNRIAILNMIKNHGASLGLHAAVFCGDLERVKQCIEIEKDYVDKQDEYCRTPLHIAIVADREEVADYLLSKGASTEIQNSEKKSPLFLAVECLNPRMIKLLSKYKVNINPFTTDNKKHILEFLYENHTSPYEDLNKERMFHSVVKALLEAGSDPSLYTKVNVINEQRNYNCALLLSIQRFDLKYFKLFLKYSKSLNFIRGEYNENLLLLICNRVFKTEEEEKILYEMARVLVCEHIADVMSVDENFNTPLHLAARTGMSEIIKLLVMYGAKPNVVNLDGLSPLVVAVFNLQTKAALTLVKQCGASHKLRTSPKNQTLLHLLYDFETLSSRYMFYIMNFSQSLEYIQEMAEFCIRDLGVDPRAVDSNGKTAKDYAIQNGYVRFYPVGKLQ
ncbi:hypothetical protein ABK040_009150 [Willaertia magna]